VIRDLFSADAGDLSQLRQEAAGWRACPLWENATQTVFGQGPAPASVMLVGEQPGDREDLEGLPFVGPAGRILTGAIDQAGLDRTQTYTNAVKHFKWTPRGKRRIHQWPNQAEIRACRTWLEREVEMVRPKYIVCLGATAATSVVGRDVRVTKDRGQLFETALGPPASVTIHPSVVLRAQDDDSRAEQQAILVEDLARVTKLLHGG
jgi:uracil-DNA glycosylase